MILKIFKKRLPILHVNIRSLHKNLGTLKHELIHSLDYHPDVICLPETKLKDALLTNAFLTRKPLILYMLIRLQMLLVVGVYVSNKFFYFCNLNNDLLLNCKDTWVQI